MVNIDFILTVLAIVSFALAAANVKVGTVNLIGLGLLFWTLTLVV